MSVQDQLGSTLNMDNNRKRRNWEMRKNKEYKISKNIMVMVITVLFWGLYYS